MAGKSWTGREKNVTGGGKGVRKGGTTGGSGVGGGTTRPPTTGGGTTRGSGPLRPGTSGTSTVKKSTPLDRARQASAARARSGGRTSFYALLLAILVGGLGLFFGSGSGPAPPGLLQGLTGGPAVWTSLLGISPAWDGEANTGVLDTTVDPAARPKFTQLSDGGRAVVMVYLCGTDLESRSGMATSDLWEMAQAGPGKDVDLVVFTGGCVRWHHDLISDDVCQIWQIRDGQMSCLEEDLGPGPMTDPATLEMFLRWCAERYADRERKILIFWDHGGGALGGYAYDEKDPSSGSLGLSDLDDALEATGMRYDLIGFDACLMATAETALAMSRHADYLVASEQTEPGVGWDHTGWLSALSASPSMPTVELGRRIADDFVDACVRSCRGQPATLSVVDLAELGQTLGDRLDAFARDTRDLIANSGYRQVSSARSRARAFEDAVDQIDLVHFARDLGTETGDALAETVLSAVKYNRTASITNAYGLSIYFPYEKISQVDQAVETYGEIGLDGEYVRCIREFAAVEVSGQAAAGGTASPLPSLLGALDLSAVTDSLAGWSGPEELTGLLSRLFSGQEVPGLSSEGREFLRGLDPQTAAACVASDRFDPSYLIWEDGKIALPEEQWERVRALDLDLFYDDGEGFIDLGLDDVYEIDADGALLGDLDGTWISIDGQPVAYYHLSTSVEGDAYTVSGRVPVLLDGERMDLILLFTDAVPHGYIAGARPMYADTDTVARGLIPVGEGDTLVFLCDYYGYDGTFQAEYTLGDPLTLGPSPAISDTYIGDGAAATYRFTDLYGNWYWTPPIPD